MTAASFSLERVRLLAVCAIKEALWHRFVRLAMLIALGLITATWFLLEFSFGESPVHFITRLGLGVMTSFGCVLVVVMGAQTFFDDVEQGSALITLSKPLRRAEWLLGKLVALISLSALFCIGLAAMIASLIWIHSGPTVAGSDYARLAIATLLQWIKFSVLAAMVLFIATFSRGILSTIITSFSVVVICTFQGLAQGVYARSVSAVIRGMARTAGFLLPDFSVFDPPASVLPVVALFSVVAQAMLYMALFAGLAHYIFRQREF